MDGIEWVLTVTLCLTMKATKQNTSSKCRYYDQSTRNSNRSGAKPDVLIAACACAWMSGVEPKEQLEWDRVAFSSANSKKPCNVIGCLPFVSSNQSGLRWMHATLVLTFSFLFFFSFFFKSFNEVWCLLLIIILYHQTKIPIDFLCRDRKSVV